MRGTYTPTAHDVGHACTDSPTAGADHQLQPSMCKNLECWRERKKHTAWNVRHAQRLECGTAITSSAPFSLVWNPVLAKSLGVERM